MNAPLTFKEVTMLLTGVRMMKRSDPEVGALTEVLAQKLPATVSATGPEIAHSLLLLNHKDLHDPGITAIRNFMTTALQDTEFEVNSPQILQEAGLLCVRPDRLAERRVGEECARRCRSRGYRYY